jgi:uncharacterized iron-regulated membrane protein
VIRKLTEKIHMYAGLLTLTALVVWGIAGIHAIFLPPPGGYQPPEISEVRELPYEAAGNLDDKELAAQIYTFVDIPLAGGHYNIHRDPEQNLKFFVFTVSGRREITYLEDRQAVRVEVRQNTLMEFLSSMHTSNSHRGPKVLAAQMWGIYNEFSTWAFTFMTLSGVYLWLASRPGLLWARLIAGTSAVMFVVLWMVTR